MKFYDSLGPNPRVVRMFMQEKRIADKISFEQVDIMSGANRREPYLSRNPSGQMPALELDDRSVVAEITAICEYLEEKYPDPPLVGRTAEERAKTRMWTRRVDLNICEPLANGFRYAEGLAMFKDRMRTIPQAAADLKALAAEKLTWLDGLIAGQDFLGGSRFSLADILLYCFLDFGAKVGQPLDPANKNLTAWFQRVNARPSADSSLHPIAKGAGMRA
jgi:glutathione S-transferase